MQRVLVFLMCTLFLSGCSSWMFWRDAQALQVVVNIEAENNINPNINGLASPLEIRIYQLADSEAFTQANFIDLYRDDQGVLKAGLLSKRQLDSILPSETHKVSLPQNSEIKYVGVVAAFSNYREAKSTAILSVQSGFSIVVNISIDGVNITVTGEED